MLTRKIVQVTGSGSGNSISFPCVFQSFDGKPLCYGSLEQPLLLPQGPRKNITHTINQMSTACCVLLPHRPYNNTAHILKYNTENNFAPRRKWENIPPQICLYNSPNSPAFIYVKHLLSAFPSCRLKVAYSIHKSYTSTIKTTVYKKPNKRSTILKHNLGWPIEN